MFCILVDLFYYYIVENSVSKREKGMVQGEECIRSIIPKVTLVKEKIYYCVQQNFV